MTALTRALKLQDKAGKVGFDWNDPMAVLAKIREECDEIEAEIASGDRPKASAEVGDLLFAAVNLARHLDTDPEAALRGCNQKFVRRFARSSARLRRKASGRRTRRSPRWTRCGTPRRLGGRGRRGFFRRGGAGRRCAGRGAGGARPCVTERRWFLRQQATAASTAPPRLAGTAGRRTAPAPGAGDLITPPSSMNAITCAIPRRLDLAGLRHHAAIWLEIERHGLPRDRLRRAGHRHHEPDDLLAVGRIAEVPER